MPDYNDSGWRPCKRCGQIFMSTTLPDNMPRAKRPNLKICLDCLEKTGDLMNKEGDIIRSLDQRLRDGTKIIRSSEDGEPPVIS